jgi:hypothetical protein
MATNILEVSDAIIIHESGTRITGIVIASDKTHMPVPA